MKQQYTVLFGSHLYRIWFHSNAFDSNQMHLNQMQVQMRMNQMQVQMHPRDGDQMQVQMPHFHLQVHIWAQAWFTHRAYTHTPTHPHTYT